MNFKYFALLLLVMSGQASQATQYHDVQYGGMLYRDDSFQYDYSNFKIFEFKNVTISSDNLLVSTWNLVCWASSYVYTPRYQKRINNDRKELDREYGWCSTDHFIQNFSEDQRFYNNSIPLHSYDIDGTSSDRRIDPIFEKYEFYRFPAFQVALYDNLDFEFAILRIEQNLGNLSKRELNPPGFKIGELQAIVTELANTARKDKNSLYRYEIQNTRRMKQSTREFKTRELEERIAAGRESTRRAAIKEEKQALQIKQVTAIMQNDDELKAYYQAYPAIDFQEVDGTETPQAQFAQKRYAVLHDYMLGKDDWKEEKYPISTDVKALLYEHTINELAYSTLFGNQVQHILHQEFLTILEGSAEMLYRQDNIPQDCKDITTTLTLFAHAGQLHNHAGYIKKAYTFADFCWGMIDCVQRAYEFECELEYAVGRGLIKGGNNFASKILDPIKTIEDMRTGLTSLAKLAFELNEDLKDKAYQHIKRKIVQRTRDIRDLTLGRTTLQKLIQRDYNEFTYSCDQTVTQVNDAIQFVWGKLDKENILYATENGTALITEMALSHATFSALGSLASSGGAALSGIIESGGGAGNFLNLPFNSSTLQAGIAYEAIFVDSAQQGAQLVQVASVGIAQALDKASVIAPPLLMATNGGAGGSGPNNPVNNAGNIFEKFTRKPKPRNWSPDEGLMKLEEFNNPLKRGNIVLTGITYNELLQAHNLFKDVPGFLSKSGPFQNVINHCLNKDVHIWDKVKGFAFEIKTALQLEAQNIKVLEFGKKMGSREIDIITEKLWIECKDWTWQYAPPRQIEGLFSTAGQVRDIAKAQGATYAIFSNHPIPGIIKDRLIKKGILFFEG